MSSMNNVRKLQMLYFSKKNKKIKNLKNDEKSGPKPASIHTTSDDIYLCWISYNFFEANV